MKLYIFVVFCLFLTLQCETVSCGLVTTFIEKGHKVIDTVKEDVKNVLHLNKNKEEDNAVETEKLKKQNEPEKISISTESNKTDKKETTETEIKDKNEVVTTTAKSSSTTESTDIISSTAAPAQNSTETKEGRENFKASCAAGYKRTADGRCKPTF
ncbi:hypothetical protein O0L34_g8921 [Tuta absoluta]|nr:hypothetical protein O0L34_g8921 [Tuta absoluta]